MQTSLDDEDTVDERNTQPHTKRYNVIQKYLEMPVKGFCCLEKCNVICLPTERQEFTKIRLKCPRILGLNWNLEMLVFEERGKPEYPEKNLSEKEKEPTTNSTHI